MLDGGEVVIWKARYESEWPKYIANPGQIVGRVPGRGVVVKTGDSTLLVEEAEMRGAASRPLAKWKIGARLG